MGSFSSRPKALCPNLEKSRASSAVKFCISEMSAPATKDFSPAPLKIRALLAARSSFKIDSSRVPSVSSLSRTLEFKALSFSGRTATINAAQPGLVRHRLVALQIHCHQVITGLENALVGYLVETDSQLVLVGRDSQIPVVTVVVLFENQTGGLNRRIHLKVIYPTSVYWPPEFTRLPDPSQWDQREAGSSRLQPKRVEVRLRIPPPAD